MPGNTSERIPAVTKRVVIVAGGWIRRPSLLKGVITKDDFVIAANGGLVHLEEDGFRPDLLIGDLDSLEEGERRRAEEQGIRILTHSREKDDTDTELAIQHALEIDPEEIILVAGIGDRIDHTLSNVGLLLYGLRQRIPMWLTDGMQDIFLTDDRAEVFGKKGDVVSLLPWTEKVEGVTTESLQYPLLNGMLSWGHSLGVSNELTAAKATIEISSGILLVIHVHNGQA
jgi:thiamine pyrophosphokinase